MTWAKLLHLLDHLPAEEMAQLPATLPLFLKDGEGLGEGALLHKPLRLNQNLPGEINHVDESFL